jgi:hypothetical protein
VSLIGLIDTGMFDFFDFFEINIHHLKRNVLKGNFVYTGFYFKDLRLIVPHASNK